ncbi:hypothetical protein WI25_34840 [Burkholderia cepacia]|nr:hypothetical protein WI25_34840 [Burkholderia cepacia]
MSASLGIEVQASEKCCSSAIPFLLEINRDLRHLPSASVSPAKAACRCVSDDFLFDFEYE